MEERANCSSPPFCHPLPLSLLWHYCSQTAQVESDSARLEPGPEPIAAGPDGTKHTGSGGDCQTCSSFSELQPLSQTLLISSCCCCRLPCPGATVVKPHSPCVCSACLYVCVCVRVMGVFLSSFLVLFTLHFCLCRLQASRAPVVSAACVRSLQVGPDRVRLNTACLLGSSSTSGVWAVLCSTCRGKAEKLVPPPPPP